MNYLKKIMIASSLIIGLVVVAVPSKPVAAIDVFPATACPAGSASTVCKAKGEDNAAAGTKRAKALINTALYILGMLASAMIIFGGIRYTKATGDPSKIKQAKDTISWSVAGLVVALLAFAIVNYVLTQFK